MDDTPCAIADTLAKQTVVKRRLGQALLVYTLFYVAFVYYVGWGGLVFHIGLFILPFVAMHIAGNNLNDQMTAVALPQVATSAGVDIDTDAPKPNHFLQLPILPLKTIRATGPKISGVVDGRAFTFQHIEIIHRTLGRSTGEVTFEGVVLQFEIRGTSQWYMFHDEDVRVFEDRSRSQIFIEDKRIVFAGLAEDQIVQKWTAFEALLPDGYKPRGLQRTATHLTVAMSISKDPLTTFGLQDNGDDLTENLQKARDTMNVPAQIFAKLKGANLI